MTKTDLSQYRNDAYDPGASLLKRFLWHIASCLFFGPMFPFGSVRVSLLRLFGAQVGSGVVIKPSVRIKSPWLLHVADYVWIGECAWIDNLVKVSIGPNACISQGAMLLTGNHNYLKSTFDLITGEIVLEEGAWIAAKAIVCPGVTCQSHSVLTVSSVATSDLEAYGVYRGNPAVRVRERLVQ